ncbi:hypothetical protein HG531_004236 [Fusarium graminearum]|nr:hypothetical protein HG531_004236 [Fusarium graminearum]
MAGCLVLGQNPVQQLKFTRRPPQEIVADVERIHDILNNVKHKWMVTKLSQLHNHVAESTSTRLATLAVTNNKLVVGNHLLVELGLKCRKLALDDLFRLVGKIFLDILLQTTQKEGSQNLVKTPDNKNLLFFSQLGVGVLHSVAFVNDHVEPLNLAKDRSVLDDVFTLDLILLELATDEHVSLSGNLFANTMCHGIVVDLLVALVVLIIVAVFFHRQLISIAISLSGLALLCFDGGGKLVQETVSLLEQVRDTGILGLVKQLEVRLFIVGLEGLQTLLSSSLNTLLLFLLNVEVLLVHETRQLV